MQHTEKQRKKRTNTSLLERMEGFLKKVPKYEGLPPINTNEREFLNTLLSQLERENFMKFEIGFERKEEKLFLNALNHKVYQNYAPKLAEKLEQYAEIIFTLRRDWFDFYRKDGSSLHTFATEQSRIRKKIKVRENVLLDLSLRIPKEKLEELKYTQRKKQKVREQSVTEINPKQARALHKRLVNGLKSDNLHELTLCIMGLTGRRPYEIWATGEFKKIEDTKTSDTYFFRGFAKKRKNQNNEFVRIPHIAGRRNINLLFSAIEKIKSACPAGGFMDSKHRQNYNSNVLHENNFCKKYLPEYIRKPYDLRKFFVAYSIYTRLEYSEKSVNAFVRDILGHEDTQAQQYYTVFRIV